MNYSMLKQEAERIKQEFSLFDYFQNLVNSGFLKYEGIQGKEHFFGFLNQRTGSIAVDVIANVWYDHAAGTGGDIIKAVQIFENKTFFQSVERLSKSVTATCVIQRQKPKPAPKIIVEKVVEITHDALISYVCGRGIRLNEINRFAKEIHWRNKGKRYFAIGFPNQSGGWVLRSSIFKGNILGGGISVEILGKPGKTKIFEGWFDFLSYLKLSGASDFKAIILNSTANLSLRLMVDILHEDSPVDLYLDNDETGDAYTKRFKRVAQLYRYCRKNGFNTVWDLTGLRGNGDKVEKLISKLNICPSEAKTIWETRDEVSDQRSIYCGFEDLNDFLVAETK